MTDRYADILVVDLLGGIGDLLMVLPVIHGLARRNPGAALRVLTHSPGADLVRGDPAVTEVRTPRHGRAGAEREAVREALAERSPTLAVTTTRYDGIPDLLVASGARCVTNLWRGPPPDEPVGARYLRILHAEGLLDEADLTAVPRVWLPPADLRDGERVVFARLPTAPAAPPVVLVTDAGMAVKRWPVEHWRRLAARLAGRGHPMLVVGAQPAVPGVRLPACGLRQLAGAFAAVAARGGVVVGADTGPVRLAAAVGARTVGLFGPTSALRYGIARRPATGRASGVDLQGLPGCPYRRPTSITEQLCWWDARCPLSSTGPACMAGLCPEDVAAAVDGLTVAPGDVDAVPDDAGDGGGRAPDDAQ